MKKIIYLLIAATMALCSGCADFLDDQVPQGTLDDGQVKDPK